MEEETGAPPRRQVSDATSADELAVLRQVVQKVRRVLTDWDRFLDWVEAERRQMEHLRARLSEQEREHARLHEVCDRLRENSEEERREFVQLRSAHDALRADFEHTREELRALRQIHEGVLREQRVAYEVLDRTLRQLRS